MKRQLNGNTGMIAPLPQVAISVRDKDGRNNALDVGFCGNAAHAVILTEDKK